MRPRLAPPPRPSLTERMCRFIIFLFKLVWFAVNVLLLGAPGAVLRRCRGGCCRSSSRPARVPQLGREALQRAGKGPVLPGLTRRSTFFGAVDPSRGRWARFTQRCCPRSTAFVQATSLMLILGYFATMMFGRSVISVIQGIIGIVISVESYLAASRSDRHGLRWAALGMLFNTFLSAAVGLTILIGTDIACRNIKAEYQGACNVTQSIYGLLMLLGSSSVGIFATINAVLVYFALGAGSSGGEGSTGSPGGAGASVGEGGGGASTGGKDGSSGSSGAPSTRPPGLSLGSDQAEGGAAGTDANAGVSSSASFAPSSGAFARGDSRSRSARSLRAASTAPALADGNDWQILEDLGARTLALLAAKDGGLAGVNRDGAGEGDSSSDDEDVGDEDEEDDDDDFPGFALPPGSGDPGAVVA